MRTLLALVLLLVALLAVPVAGIELGCSAPRESRAEMGSGLVDEPGYRRPETNSYLSYPEWHIVFAYQDLAAVMQVADEHAFSYLRAIAGYWTSFCGLNRVASARGGGTFDQKVMLYLIGVSFTAELGVKGAYEGTVGRVAALIRGPQRTAEDEFARGVATEYAAFLRQTPWYDYPFAARVRQLWHDVPFGRDAVRGTERRIALTMEWGAKAGYAVVMRGLAGLAPAEERIGSVVRDLDPADVVADPRIAVERPVEGAGMLVETPRYAAFTEVATRLARRGRSFVEIAGNRAVLVTALVRDAAAWPSARELFSLPVQSRPGWRRIGLDVAVPELGALIRAMDARGAEFEHVYDY